jgi:hypothetical protein
MHGLLPAAGTYLLFALAVASAGCGSTSPVKAERPYLLEIKKRVLELSTLSASDRSASRSSLELLVENLAESSTQDLGEHQATIDQMTALAKELSTLAQGSGSSDQFQQKLEALTDLAHQLPGTVEASDVAPAGRAAGDY